MVRVKGTPWALRHQLPGKVTQEDFAAEAERHLPKGKSMSRSRYAQIEAGKGSEPSADEMNAVAAALGVKRSEVSWPARKSGKAAA
jgi:transcriptional regulator with XRE-family HTH domain